MFKELLAWAGVFALLSAALYGLFAFATWSFALSPPLWFIYRLLVIGLLLLTVTVAVGETIQKDGDE